MRKLLGALAVLALVVSQQASAFSLRNGDVTIHLRDATSLFTDVGGVMTPRAPRQFSSPPSGYAPDGVAIGDESRSVLHIDQFVYNDPPSVVPQVGELTGLVYGLTLAGIATPTATSVDLYFTGGKVDLWLDPTPENTNGILDTFDPFGDGKAPTHWTTASVFQNVNGGDDATLWLSTMFVPIGDPSLPAGTTVVTHVNLVTGAGSSDEGFLKILGGSAANLFESGNFTPPSGISADMSVAYTLKESPHRGYIGSYADIGGWQLRSEDPVLATVIPEPATMTLLGLGLAGLVAARKRSRK